MCVWRGKCKAKKGPAHKSHTVSFSLHSFSGPYFSPLDIVDVAAAAAIFTTDWNNSSIVVQV